MLQVSELSKQWDTFRHEQGGCPSNTVASTQTLSGSHAPKLAWHSQVGGAVVALQKSAFSKQCDFWRQEHEGCPGFSVTFTHSLPGSHGSKVGTLKLHSHPGGSNVALQISTSPRAAHWASLSQEQPKPGIQTRPGWHGANVGAFALHSHMCVVLLHVSAFTKQWDSFKHEHGGCPSSSVIFKHILPSSHGSNDGSLKLHPHIAGTAVVLQLSELLKQSNASKQEHAGCSGVSVEFKHILPGSQGAISGPL